jgi:hypothetical protein
VAVSPILPRVNDKLSEEEQEPNLEGITRLVADSLARHGFDRPVDPRRLQWSRWFRCDSPHSLLVVPSKPGIFALAEEIMDLGPGGDASGPSKTNVGTAAHGCSAEPSSAAAASATNVEVSKDATQRRMLAVLQFSEDDDMAFTLDRMFTCVNPMRSRLSSGRCFLRFVVIEDQDQRRSICTALNQWLLSTAGKATGLSPDFSSSLELTSVARGPSLAKAESSLDRMEPVFAEVSQSNSEANFPSAAPHLDSGAAKNLHCPQPLPSGF